MDTEHVTLLAAIIAAIAAIIAPVVSAVITSRNAYKTKTAELFFTSKVNAYTDFLSIASSITSRHDSQSLIAFQEVSSHAMLFANPKTQEKIALYGNELMKNDLTANGLAKLSAAHRDAILAMQKEIEEYRR